MKHLYFTVTNDLVFDQRMHRICTSLTNAGYKVTLVGRRYKFSPPIENKQFEQKRIRCWFQRGFFFYAEYNLRLFFFLLGCKMDGICAIDLDTILPCLFVSKIKKISRVYDAHEYFTEMKEVKNRKFVQLVWSSIELFALPGYRHCYTVSNGLADEFKRKHGKIFEVIRNVPPLNPEIQNFKKETFLFYGGAVNEARGFEYLIPAMKQIPCKLVICGDGNFMSRLKELIRQYKVQDNVELRGMVRPEQLRIIAQKALLGFNLVEREGINQYYSLANKFFDYIHAGLPQISMNFPEYSFINNEFKVAVLIDDLSAQTLSRVINETLDNPALLEELHTNTIDARQVYNWQNEEKKLVQFYQAVFAE